MTTQAATSLIPFKTGDVVALRAGFEAKAQIVRVVRHDDDWCWIEDGRCFNRNTGAQAPRGSEYVAIHTPGYRREEGVDG